MSNLNYEQEVLLLRQQLESERAQRKMLERANEQLQQMVEFLKESQRELQKTIETQRAQIAKGSSTVAAPKVSTPSIPKPQSPAQGFGTLKTTIGHMTKDQLFSFYREINLTRFIERLMQIYDFSDPERAQELLNLKNHLASKSDVELREIIRTTKLQAIYYESSSWTGEEMAGYEWKQLYTELMSR